MEVNGLQMLFHVHYPYMISTGFSQLTGNIQLMFSQDSLRVMNKHSSNNVNRKLEFSYLVFNKVLKTLAQKY